LANDVPLQNAAEIRTCLQIRVVVLTSNWPKRDQIGEKSAG
jgi:hypothetical protein